MSGAPGVRVAFLTFIAVSAAAQSPAGISIRIVQGDNAINSIRMHRGHDPVVQVLSDSGEPLSNATVSFLLPATGPGGSFGDRGLSTTVETDSHGMAIGRGLVPNRVEGQFHIRVTASWQGDAASASMQQTNAEPAGKSSRSKWIIAAVVAGGAAGGALAAMSGGKGSAAAPASGTTGGTASGVSIVPGNPSLGPPH
jgi:ABC-type xylose transport system substrate-binding protein